VSDIGAKRAMAQVDDTTVGPRHRQVRRRRVAGLLIGMACSVVSLGAWFFVPSSLYGTFRPSSFVAAWVSLIFAVAGVGAVVLGVVATLRASTLERANAELETRTHVLDVFFPLLAAAVAIAAQLDLWR